MIEIPLELTLNTCQLVSIGNRANPAHCLLSPCIDRATQVVWAGIRTEKFTKDRYPSIWPSGLSHRRCLYCDLCYHKCTCWIIHRSLVTAKRKVSKILTCTVPKHLRVRSRFSVSFEIIVINWKPRTGGAFNLLAKWLFIYKVIRIILGNGFSKEKSK